MKRRGSPPVNMPSCPQCFGTEGRSSQHCKPPRAVAYGFSLPALSVVVADEVMTDSQRRHVKVSNLVCALLNLLATIAILQIGHIFKAS
jgi:hypothetical protein